MENVTISIDVGSSGIRSCAFTETGSLVSASKCEYPTIYSTGGVAEQDVSLWESAMFQTLRNVSEDLGVRYRIAALAMTGQCPTYVPVDRNVRPVGHALTYQDNRAIAESDELRETVGDAYVHERSGHTIFPFFILPKILWQKKHMPRLFEKVDHVLQPIDYLEYILTGEIATDAAYACGTLAYAAAECSWNHSLLSRLGLKTDIFPQKIINATDVVGTISQETARKTGIPEETPVVRGGPDSQCCCYGIGALREDTLSNMSGTSTCLNSVSPSMNPDLQVGNYVHVVSGQWCMEVGLNTTGASMKKLSAILFPGCTDVQRYNWVEHSGSVTPPGSRDLLFFPYLSNGERDNPVVKGGFYGLNMMHESTDLMCAVMEGVAFAEKERAQRMRKGKSKFTSMRISGGGSKTQEWNRIKANVMGIPTYALKSGDAAEIGTAAIAAVGAGIFATMEEALDAYRLQFDEYLPQADKVEAYKEIYNKFLSVEKDFERK